MMDKTVKINLAGILFQIDEEAYLLLRDYLQSINARFKNVPGGNETIDDIEARIAEIFQSQKGLSGIISKENVEVMISIIGKPEDFEHGESASEASTFGVHRRHLYRNRDDTIISGVCGGIGAYLNIDSVWIRVFFILFTVFFGMGFFVYIALWIALTDANTDSRKRELYGENFNTRSYRNTMEKSSISASVPHYRQENNKVNAIGRAFNEIFRVTGKLFFIFFRVILILTGLSFVLAGFALLIAFIMMFFFRYPGLFSIDSFGVSLFYLPDFLKFFTGPAVTPWIMFLTSIIVILPLLAVVYWGLKMIFWFRAKERIVSLVALVVWVLSISALAIILFNEGISFAESGRKNEQIILEHHYDTLYLKIDRKISDLKFEKEITLPKGNYSLYINQKDNELFGSPQIRLYDSRDQTIRIEVNKKSNGRTIREAVEKAESLIFNYRLSKDTIYLDEFYKIPTTFKWTGADVDINLFIPEGTVIWFDKESENFFHDYVSHGIYSWELGGKYWTWTEERLEEKVPAKSK